MEVERVILKTKHSFKPLKCSVMLLSHSDVVADK